MDAEIKIAFLDQILFVHQPIHMIVDWNAKKLHKIHKKLGEIGSEIQQRVVTRKLQKTTKELDLDNFETTSRFLTP